MKFFSLIFVNLLICSITVQPQITIHVPGNYPKIQVGIYAASNNDLVLLDGVTYINNINLERKTITVASHFIKNRNKSHIENTIIDGSQPLHQDTAPFVLFISGEDTTSLLKGFIITGGRGILGYSSVRVGGDIAVYTSGAKICVTI